VALLIPAIILSGAACASRSGDTPGANVAPTSTAGEPEPSPTAGPTTIRGLVVEGVESGCMLLDTGGGTPYLLLGGDRALIVANRRLEVTGRAQPDLMTTCQQGTPFQVSGVRAI
jgi:hypothetical protein